MDGRCDTSHSTGVCTIHAGGDGAEKCTLNGTTWQYPITVWRGITFQAEAAEGGAWLNNGNGCTPGTSGCTWTPGGLGFNASNCMTPGSNGCALIVDSKNGNGKRVGWLGPSKGVVFRNVSVAVGGTNNLVVYYTSADVSTRYLRFSVNGGMKQDISIPGGTSWSDPIGMTVSLSGFNTGSDNTIFVTADDTHSAPDLDWIEIINTSASGGSTTCGSPAAWTESASRNSVGAGQATDNDLTTRWTTSGAMAAGDSFTENFGSTVTLKSITLNNTQTSANDYPAAMELYASADGTSFEATPFASGNGAPSSTTISFSAKSMKAVKVKIKTVNAYANWWSIGEFQATCQ
jgi:hypothetical protein